MLLSTLFFVIISADDLIYFYKNRMFLKKNFLLSIFILTILLIPIIVTAVIEGGTDPVSLTNPLGEGKTSIPELIGRIINGVLGIVGSLALVMFIYGGFTWMTAAGNSEKVQKGKDILIWASIGLVVIFASYALVNFVIFEAINPSGQ